MAAGLLSSVANTSKYFLLAAGIDDKFLVSVAIKANMPFSNS